MNRDREHSCDGKSPFASFRLAARALDRMFRRRGRGERDAARKRGMHVYRCPFCPYYHIGHREDLVRRKGFRAAS